MNGAVFYRGPSLIDGRPIVGIATLQSSNRKTGDMIQTWILRDRVSPVSAVRTGGDVSICGDCFHRGSKDRPRTCYVNVGQAPLGIWKAYKRGKYERADLDLLLAATGYKPIRIGAYGDPVAIPIEAWHPKAIQKCMTWTGYTHQWRNPHAAAFQDVIMASCETPADALEAACQGWRTFLTRKPGETSKIPDMMQCLNAIDNRNCVSCGLCDGASSKAPSVWIEAHGTAKAYV